MKGQEENTQHLLSAEVSGPFLSLLNLERNFLSQKQSLRKVNLLAQGHTVTKRQGWGLSRSARFLKSMPVQCSSGLLSTAPTVMPVLQCPGNHLTFIQSEAESSSPHSSCLSCGWHCPASASLMPTLPSGARVLSAGVHCLWPLICCADAALNPLFPSPSSLQSQAARVWQRTQLDLNGAFRVRSLRAILLLSLSLVPYFSKFAFLCAITWSNFGQTNLSFCFRKKKKS